MSRHCFNLPANLAAVSRIKIGEYRLQPPAITTETVQTWYFHSHNWRVLTRLGVTVSLKGGGRTTVYLRASGASRGRRRKGKHTVIPGSRCQLQ